jgi:hypothetical protein
VLPYPMVFTFAIGQRKSAEPADLFRELIRAITPALVHLPKRTILQPSTWQSP